MKNRKIILVAFMLVACMLISVGYATIEKVLTITGEASFYAQKFNTGFKSVTLTTLTDHDTGDGANPSVSVENNTLTLNTTRDLGNIFATSLTVTGLSCTEDKVVVEYVIENKNNVTIHLSPSITGNSIFSVDGEFDGGEETYDLAADATVIYTVTIALVSDSYDKNSSESFTISINATSNLPNPS